MNREASISTQTALLMMALAGLAGCGSLPGTRPAGEGQRLAVETPASTASDEAISQNVRIQLQREVPAADIDVRTAHGKVELSGNVEDADAARRAVKGALNVEGVHGVVNDLNVDPESSQSASLSVSAL